MCGDEDIIRKFMLAAYDNDMTSGDYVFISLTLLPSGRVTTPWVRHDARDNDAMRAYQPLLEVLQLSQFAKYLQLIYFVFSALTLLVGRQEGHPVCKQEAQLSPSNRAMRLVSSNLASCHATVQKVLVQQVLNKSKL